MPGFVVGLLVAFGGALLLAAGSELQSHAVHRVEGRWSLFLRSPVWWAGFALLATAISTNFVALSLTPVSAVQSVSIAALAVSTAFGALARRVVVSRRVVASILLCVVGDIGFIAVLGTHPAAAIPRPGDLYLTAVTAILGTLVAVGIVAMLLGGAGRSRPVQLLALVAGATVFGSITTVFKVMVELSQRDGVAAVLSSPAAWISLSVVAAGGIVANVLLQRAHRSFPPPAVVASITVIDPLTAAVIGVTVLGESALTPPATGLLAVSAAIACLGVAGLGRLTRRDPALTVPHPSA
ncbi:MAG: multidrug transporter permease [Microbacterium sp.]|nr:multidrug transporter permease [Microbacterium sp.]